MTPNTREKKKENREEKKKRNLTAESVVLAKAFALVNSIIREKGHEWPSPGSPRKQETKGKKETFSTRPKRTILTLVSRTLLELGSRNGNRRETEGYKEEA